MTKRPLPLASILLVSLILPAGAVLRAQQAVYEFGPPLRANIVFSYKYTEKVREIHESEGQVLDSSARTQIYYVSERQRPLSNGRWQIEVNIDSMRNEYVHNGETLVFNTQAVAPSVNFNDREILGPSVIVNRPAMVTLSPYGEILEVKSESFDGLVEQLSDTTVDPVTRERVLGLITPEYVSAVFLPWRSVAPLGQSVKSGDTIHREVGLAIDRIPVRANAASVVTGSKDKPILNFSADIVAPARKMAAYTELLQPVAISGISGRINGGLTLDQDGVVVSGWTAAKATVNATSHGQPLTTTIWHETFTEAIGMIQLD